MVQLDHVGIAVRDMAPVLRVLEDVFGLRPYKSEEIKADRIRTHFVCGGTAKLELLESLDESSPVARFLEKRGEGLHHLAFEVEDIDAFHRRIEDLGYRLIDTKPRKGADGKRIFFVHPKDTAGILFEFCESTAPVLRPAGTTSGLRVSESRTGHLSRLAYLQPAESGKPRDDIVRKLEQQYSVLGIEIPADGDVDALQVALGDLRVHLLAVGRTATVALRHARRSKSTVSSLVLYHPEVDADAVRDDQQRAAPACPTLIIAGDNDELDTALTLRFLLQGSRLAVLPADDPATVAQLIERHVDSAATQ